MKTTIALSALVPAALLAACATTAPDDGGGDMPDAGGNTGACDAAAAQSFVGQKVTGEIGANIQREAGAKQLRWGPPDSAWTMDFRPDRVNVRYDRAMTITEITCG
ncbi:I78 family peptidase inhibitor [Pelagerythrobacter sp.]|uniref:I78 family peptidase inhibitor n=1 Tax=Pelagerythrobacter sp. TaxID=2800702 RepID=UPI0035B3E415